MVLDDIIELELVGTFERGVPNSERIVFRANSEIEVARYGVMLGIQQHENYPATPIRNYMFWFGDGTVQPGEWIFLYTGAGADTKTTLQNTDETAYVQHWGLPQTIFVDPSVIPVLFRIDAVTLGKRPINLPQLGRS